MKPYAPARLPPKNLDHRILIGLVGRANASLARYDGLLQGMVNPIVLLSPLTTQEAVISSRIEGTQATLDEVLELEAGEVYEAEKEQDINEIVNYRNALMQGWGYVRDRNISLAAIRQMHKILMESVRGKDKKPGGFREEQVWIGPHGTPIEKATFIPPNPLILNDYLEDLESYIKQDDFDPIVQTAIIHA